LAEGLFVAAYHLRDVGELPRHDRERLEQLLAWFEAELAIPPRGMIPVRAIFWYANVGPFSQRMWELAQLLDDYDFTAEQITARVIGQVVYRDKHQRAALPSRRRH
jgi:hypothetical protein